MKKCLMGLLVFALMIGSAGATSVFLNPSTQTIGNSATTTVDLVISGNDATGINTLNVVLRFDETLVNATAVVTGGVTAGAINFGIELDNVNGEVSFTFWNLMGAWTADGTLATLTFVSDASNTGTSPLDYTAWLLYPVPPGGQMAATLSTGDDIIVGDSEGPVVPEPATLMLLAAGLAAIGGYARKKRS